MRGRVLRRLALAAQTGLAPSAFHFVPTAHGLPVPHTADGRSLPVGLSLAHTGSMVAVAVCQAQPLGLDLERADRFAGRMDVPGRLARRFFTPEERARGAGGAKHFLQQWALKEAALKALGRGLTGEWTQVAPEVPLGPFTEAGVRWARAPLGAARSPEVPTPPAPAPTSDGGPLFCALFARSKADPFVWAVAVGGGPRPVRLRVADQPPQRLQAPPRLG